MIKNNKSYQYPPRHKEILTKMKHLDYEGNFLLPSDATPLEKTKYKICQRLLAYKQDNNLAIEELAIRISLSVPETKEILLSHIHKFTMDRLNFCLTYLFPNVEHEIFKEYQTIPHLLSPYLRSMLFISNTSCKADRTQQ